LPHIIVLKDELGNIIGEYEPPHGESIAAMPAKPSIAGLSADAATHGTLTLNLGLIFERWHEKPKKKGDD
jgi:hypothetical protein